MSDTGWGVVLLVADLGGRAPHQRPPMETPVTIVIDPDTRELEQTEPDDDDVDPDDLEYVDPDPYPARRGWDI